MDRRLQVQLAREVVGLGLHLHQSISDLEDDVVQLGRVLGQDGEHLASVLVADGLHRRVLAAAAVVVVASLDDHRQIAGDVLGSGPSAFGVLERGDAEVEVADQRLEKPRHLLCLRLQRPHDHRQRHL